MPFGLIFAAVYFGFLCLWLGAQFLGIPWGPARATGVLIWLLGLSLGLGLLQRRGWARWTGALAAVALSVLTLWLVAERGSVLDHLAFLASLATAVLLLIPATGDVRRGLSPEATPRSRAGRAAALGGTAALVGFLVTAVWSWNAPAPEHPLGARELPDVWNPVSVEWAEFGPGLEQAQRDGKLVFVDFYASWCGPCHKMDRLTFRHPEVARLLNDGEIVAVRIDSEETEEKHGYVGLELAERYEVLSYPTVALLDADGALLARRSGYLGPRELVRWLERSLEQARRNKSKRFA